MGWIVFLLGDAAQGERFLHQALTKDAHYWPARLHQHKSGCGKKNGRALMRLWYKWQVRPIMLNWLLKPNGYWSGIIASARTVLVLLWLVGMGGCNALSSPIPSNSPDHLLFYDDFSDPQRGWQRWENEQAEIVYREGGLRFSINAPYYDYWSLAGFQIEDAILAVEARVVGGPLNNDFGLICRYKTLVSSMRLSSVATDMRELRPWMGKGIIF